MTDFSNKKQKPHIVILGAGFAGIYTFLNLRRVLPAKKADITIVNKNNYFLFTPLLHEVATGGLAHHQVVEAIRSITYKHGANLHVADVKKIDTQNKKVETSVGPIDYDFLVIATGASTEFFGTPGAQEHSFVLKDLHDAIKMRNYFIDTFERAVEIKSGDERRKLLTFVLVGGGATGVELAAEMSELFNDTFEKFYCGKISSDDISINLIAGEPELLARFDKNLRMRAQQILSKNHVNIRVNTRVTSVDERGVTLSDGSRLETEHVIWVGGVSPNVPASDQPLTTEKSHRRIAVDKFLRVKGLESAGVYALGDVATFEEEMIPMLAQVAVQAAEISALNIYNEIRGRKLREFRFKSLGDLVSLGRWQAAGHVLKIFWSGPLAWFIWRTVYLFKFASWPKRIKIMVDWTIDIFYPRDITKA